jgi:RNA polymerase sigma-70 factor, ECF subfamily
MVSMSSSGSFPLAVSGNPPDDAALLAATARGEQSAFAELLSRHYKPVYRVVWRMTGGHADTEDIAQEAFIKLWQNPGQVREAGALKGWLMRVASNAVIDRSRKLRPQPLDDVPEVADSRMGQEDSLERSAAAHTIDSRIADLPDRQRLALTLVYYEGFSNIDAARVMETTVEAVESLLSRARRSLKATLASQWRDLLDGLDGAGT